MAIKPSLIDPIAKKNAMTLFDVDGSLNETKKDCLDTPQAGRVRTVTVFVILK